jgi:hypothetical protein
MSRETREEILERQRVMTAKVHKIYARLPLCEFCGMKIDRTQPRKMRDEIRKRYWRGSFCRCMPQRRTSKKKPRYNYVTHNETRGQTKITGP